MPQAWNPSAGKLEETAVFSPYCEANATIYLTEPNKRLCYSMRLFHLHSAVRIQPFSSVFPLAESITKEFCWLFLCKFKEKSINHFLEHSKIKKEGSRNSLPIEANRNRRQPTSIRKRTSGSQHRGRCFRGSCQRPYPKHFRRGQG